MTEIDQFNPRNRIALRRQRERFVQQPEQQCVAAEHAREIAECGPQSWPVVTPNIFLEEKMEYGSIEG